MKETNEQLIARKEIKDALETLLRACQRNKAAFVGFVFGTDPPILLQFGNVKETGSELTALLVGLGDLADEKEQDGLTLKDPLTGIN
jgi:hypothetical protein